MATVGDIFRIVVDGVLTDSQTWQNVWHYYVSAGSSVDYQAIVEAIELSLGVSYGLVESQLSDDVVSTDVILSEWDFTNHEWDGKAQSSASIVVGALAGEVLPAGNAVVVRFFTEELRRQARKFLPGIVETLSSGNDLSGTLVTAALNFAGDVVDPFTADGLTVNLCTFNDQPLSVRYETWSLFTGDYFVNSKSGYQRRRQVGAGI